MNIWWPLRRLDFDASRIQRKAFRSLMEEHDETNRIDAHEVVFGELVTNAILYGEEPMSVAVDVDHDVMRISVENTGACFDLPATLRREPTDRGGRGLRIVSALADTLRVECVRQGQCRVTATVALMEQARQRIAI